MKILQFKSGKTLRLGICKGEQVVDLAAALAALRPDASAEQVAAVASTFDLLNAEGGLDLAAELVKQALAAPDAAHVLPLASLDLGAPITRPEKIIGVGSNYYDHLEEMGHDVPQIITNFPMYGNALVGTSDPIVIPRNSEMIGWEAELVLVIGRTARFVEKEQAMDYLLGYSCGNEVVVVDHMRADRQLLRGKTQDSHAPMGPWIVTKDEVGDPSDLNIRLSVNGEEKQNGSTSGMVFDIPAIISFFSKYFTLRPGDVIFTGTPAGGSIGMKPPQWLKAGDRVEVEIEKVGRLVNDCVAEKV
ncbi:fumarylacetoacetate hydrolase family protein [Paracoccus thiocyanatus]|uniref:Fumarylacetoacetase-like C-terminal domain-containing protein n=1 Tax=Paracoccus thiocyanatus TaxID=34006 RepID=A0A3D8PCJ3_9RHOB|nr:fumarylacetoacetate hydrolase family protein [Paracoccus thiocyanatus]RDW12879.1 hypothetical protein DIE28_11165 [Paracoccus thiocyanatus]